jgi:hypothetical protein
MPRSVRIAFQERVHDLLRDYGELLLAVHGKTRKASLEGMLSEQATMSLGVFWEAFIHEVFVAYATQNSGNCVRDYRNRLEKNLKDKFSIPSTWIRIRIPARPSAAQIEKMLDPKGWNLDATSAIELRNKANQHLQSADARHFSLSGDDAIFIDFLVAVRNHLAHRSTSSRGRLTVAAKQMTPTGTNAALAAPIKNLGAYLKASTTNADRRVHAVGHRLITIASTLVP